MRVGVGVVTQDETVSEAPTARIVVHACMHSGRHSVYAEGEPEIRNTDIPQTNLRIREKVAFKHGGDYECNGADQGLLKSHVLI